MYCGEQKKGYNFPPHEERKNIKKYKPIKKNKFFYALYLKDKHVFLTKYIF